MSWLFILIIAIDQITKRIATYYFDRNMFFSFYGLSNTLVSNKGISFSAFADYKYFFLLKYIGSIGLIFIFYFLYKSNDKLESFSLNLILAGGISNLLDRFLFDGVIDFLVIKIIFIPEFICNFADCSVSFGVFLLFVKILLDYKKSDCKKND